MLLIPTSPSLLHFPFSSSFSFSSSSIIKNLISKLFFFNSLKNFGLSFMTLSLSHLLSLSIYTSLFVLALKMIMPCYYYYYFSQFMMKKSKYFCKRSVHFFLGLSNAIDSPSPPLSKCGLGLITNESPPRVVSPNVIESSSVLHHIKPVTPTPSSKKKDPGGIGFIDDMGGAVDGLMSCTESLGFESCDERRVDDDNDNDNDDGDRMKFCEGERDRWRRKRSEEKRERNKKFPPPLSSLNQNGQPCFYLKPVRKNGRLELIEIGIQRPEILRAVRENGRLRLHLVSSDVCSKINEEEEENEETKQEEQDLHLQEEEVELQEEVEEVWKYRVSGEGFRRCNELVMSHRHHDYHHHHINCHQNLHVWRQPCVTR